MEDILGLNAVMSQMTIEMVVEMPADDPQTIEMAVETSVDNLQDLGGLQDQLNTFIMGQQSIETVRKTKREAKAFQTWLDGRREAEGLPMAKIEPKRLKDLLGNYLLNKRKKNGEEYEPSSLAGTFFEHHEVFRAVSIPCPTYGD